MSAEELYEDPVWWSSDELQEYCEERYGDEAGEAYERIMRRLSETDMREDAYRAAAVVWGREDEPILGQMEMDNHLVYRVEDADDLLDAVYDGGWEAFREEAAVDDAG